MELVYRKYNNTLDTDLILDLHKKVFEGTKVLLPPIERLRIMEGIVMKNHNIPVAYLLTSKSRKRDSTWIYLEYIGVVPEYRHNGLGGILIDLFIKNLDNNNLSSYLDIEENSGHTDNLIKWYEKYGYKVAEQGRTSKYEVVTMTRMERVKK